MAEDRLHEEPLFLACTRPSMIAGVTVEALVINVIVTSIIFLGAGSIFYAAIGLVFHMIFRAICKVDHNQFRLLFAWLNSKGRSRTKDYWGASTVSPLTIKKPESVKDLLSA